MMNKFTIKWVLLLVAITFFASSSQGNIINSTVVVDNPTALSFEKVDCATNELIPAATPLVLTSNDENDYAQEICIKNISGEDVTDISLSVNKNFVNKPSQAAPEGGGPSYTTSTCTVNDVPAGTGKCTSIPSEGIAKVEIQTNWAVVQTPNKNIFGTLLVSQNKSTGGQGSGTFSTKTFEENLGSAVYAEENGVATSGIGIFFPHARKASRSMTFTVYNNRTTPYDLGADTVLTLIDADGGTDADDYVTKTNTCMNTTLAAKAHCDMTLSFIDDIDTPSVMVVNATPKITGIADTQQTQFYIGAASMLMGVVRAATDPKVYNACGSISDTQAGITNVQNKGDGCNRPIAGMVRAQPDGDRVFEYGAATSAKRIDNGQPHSTSGIAAFSSPVGWAELLGNNRSFPASTPGVNTQGSIKFVNSDEETVTFDNISSLKLFCPNGQDISVSPCHGLMVGEIDTATGVSGPQLYSLSYKLLPGLSFLNNEPRQYIQFTLSTPISLGLMNIDNIVIDGQSTDGTIMKGVVAVSSSDDSDSTKLSSFVWNTATANSEPTFTQDFATLTGNVNAASCGAGAGGTTQCWLGGAFTGTNSINGLVNIPNVAATTPILQSVTNFISGTVNALHYTTDGKLVIGGNLLRVGAKSGPLVYGDPSMGGWTVKTTAELGNEVTTITRVNQTLIGGDKLNNIFYAGSNGTTLLEGRVSITGSSFWDKIFDQNVASSITIDNASDLLSFAIMVNDTNSYTPPATITNSSFLNKNKSEKSKKKEFSKFLSEATDGIF